MDESTPADLTAHELVDACSTAKPRGDGHLGLGMFVSLGMVVVAGLVLLLLAKGRRGANRRGGLGQRRDDAWIRVEASAPLYGRTRVVLVAASQRRLLVAVSDGKSEVLDRWIETPARRDDDRANARDTLVEAIPTEAIQ
jgi:flagellar biogenesis protein FliO